MMAYQVLKTARIKGQLYERGDYFKANSTAIAAKYPEILEKTQTETPGEACYWCTRAGRPGLEFWLNHRGFYLCRVCFAPESFPREDVSRVVFDTFSIEPNPGRAT